jgi:8-oxo-dGTP pyrophosphatase MutT (NUDIX family)
MGGSGHSVVFILREPDPFRMRPVAEKSPLAHLTVEEMRERLSTNGKMRQFIQDEGFLTARDDCIRRAAVLIPLVWENDDWSVLLTARTEFVEDHKGQVAFPGGAMELSDTGAEQAALREAEEEIGLPPAGVKVLGSLPTYLTVSNYLVTPVVAAVPWPFPLRLQTSEVSRAFTIPLAFLIRPENHSERITEIRGQKIPIIYFEAWQGEVLWGISARMMLALLDALGLN